MSSAAQTFRRATREDLLAAARRRFQRRQELDLAEIAEELGVSRATAYRWAGNTDELTGAVIASLAEANFHRCVREARGTGAARILDAQARGMRSIAASRPYREWIARTDSDTVLRIVASKQGAPQPTMIRLNQTLIEEEARARRFALPVDAHTMAYALVRTAETFLYADLIAGEKPDIDKAIVIMGLLLGLPQPAA